MEYTFAAERKVVLTVQAGGRNRLVEFGERNEAGVSTFFTTNDAVAQAIRRHSLSRRGVIVETTKPQEPAPEKAKKATAAPQKPEEKTSDGTPVRAFDNYSVARETITKELGIPKTKVRNPAALEKIAKENGFIIKYNNAQA